MTWTQARKTLARALRAPGRSQVWLAGLLGIGQPAVSGWITGKARPSIPHRQVLELVLGIPAVAWATAEERARARRFEALSV